MLDSISLDQASDIASLVTSVASVTIATIALILSREQALKDRRKAQQDLAKEAVDHFFSFELAEARFRVFNVISAACASVEPETNNEFYRRMFPIDESSSEMPSRHRIIEHWNLQENLDENEQAFRQEFQRDTAVLMSTFDMIFRAAEENRYAAAHVQQRMGRLLVWWLLLWPKLFDHTNSFMGRRFLPHSRVDELNPKSRADLYQPLWKRHTLWTHEQWAGAVENYRTIGEVHMPRSRFRRRETE